MTPPTVTWTDQWQAIASAVSAIVSFISAFFVIITIWQATRAIRSQNRSSDIASVLVIWDKIDEHWRLYKLANDETRDFEFGQLLSHYEIACSMFFHKVFTSNATRTLQEHLYEILPMMQEDAQLGLWFKSLKSNDSTFEYIRWFCRQPAPEKTKIAAF